MPDTDTIPVSASIASTGLGIRYIGDFAYAYSGPVAANNTETTLLDFTSGSGVFVGVYCPMYMTGGLQARDYVFLVKLNGETVIERIFTQNYGDENRLLENEIIIPPFTEVLLTAQNLTDTEAHNMGAKLTGRVYGEE